VWEIEDDGTFVFERSSEPPSKPSGKATPKAAPRSAPRIVEDEDEEVAEDEEAAVDEEEVVSYQNSSPAKASPSVKVYGKTGAVSSTAVQTRPVAKPAPEPVPQGSRVGMSTEELAELAKGKRGLTLLIGCVQERGSTSGLFYLDRLIAEAIDDIEREQGDCFTSMDTWGRRDLLASRVKEVVEKVGNGTVVCEDSPSSDAGAFLKYLRPHAKTVIIAIQK
jgi:hypothetical protein